MAIGRGANYQWTKILHDDLLYANFVRHKIIGLYQTFITDFSALF